MNNSTLESPILREFSVSELSQALKSVLEDTFSVVRLKGEISSCKRHSSGHVYFSLKDSDAVMDAICWRGVASKLSIQPQDGMEVVVTGRITTYPGRSKYQIIVNEMDVSGEGALLKMLEDLKRKLHAEGLFDPGHKKPIPFLPKTIGVITSPTGSVIKDMLHRLSDRMPTHVVLWPCAVQGPTAAQEVSRAIEGFNQPNDLFPKPDVVIVARGGGSLEDLWPFNEESVARATFASQIPIISAVGHETDTTLIDFVSDHRAPTPTAAAERVVPVRRDILAELIQKQSRALSAVTRFLSHKETQLEGLGRGLPKPDQVIEDAMMRVEDWGDRLSKAFENKVQNSQNQLDRMGDLLKSYSYENTLKRGFTLIKNPEGELVANQNAAAQNSNLAIHFHDGVLDVFTSPDKTGGSMSSQHTPKPKPTRVSKPKSTKNKKSDLQKSFWD